MTLRRRITPATIGLLLLTVPSFAQTPGQRIIMEQTGALRKTRCSRLTEDAPHE